jgi:hypothetical protein
MAGLGTGGTIALIGGGLVLLYLFSKSSTTTAPPAGTVLIPAGGTNPTTAAIQAQASTQNTLVNDASSNINNLINSIFS